MAKDNKTFPDKFAALRERAEALITQEGKESKDFSIEEVRKMADEFFTYKVELELQNEELRQAQIELEQSHRSYSDLYDFAPMGYLTINEAGIIVKANLTVADMLQVERVLLTKQPFSAFIQPADQDIYYNCRRTLLQSGAPQSVELQMQRRDGSSFYVQLDCSIRSETDGEPLEFRVALIDISKRKELEKTLEKSKEEWEQTFDAMYDIVTLQDKDMHIVRANKAAHEFFEVPYGEMIGKHCYEFFRGTTESCPGCPLSNALQDTNNHTAIIKHATLDKTFQVSIAPIPADNGDLPYLVHVARDITGQKRLEEKLFQAHKMEAIGTMASGIAHDFNNILGAILGYSELVQQDVPADSPIGRNIANVIISEKRAADLVQQILTFSRKTAHGKEVICPHLLVKEAIKMLRATLPASISIGGTIDPDCGTVLATPTSIYQIVVNLCTNALHAIHENKGKLRVDLQRQRLSPAEIAGKTSLPPGDFVVLTVADNGQGMDNTTMKRIFEPYFTTKGPGSGTGLGLALVHGIVRDCNGFIDIESSVGEGTTFRVFFPTAGSPPAHDSISEQKNEATRATGSERILMVDDEPLLVMINENRLQAFGYQVTAVTDSREALSLFRKHPDNFDLLITDQTMPGLTGNELTKAVLEIKPSLPVIVCTGHSETFSKEEALSMGIKKYVLKPIHSDELLDAVQELLAHISH